MIQFWLNTKLGHSSVIHIASSFFTLKVVLCWQLDLIQTLTSNCIEETDICGSYENSLPSTNLEGIKGTQQCIISEFGQKKEISILTKILVLKVIRNILRSCTFHKNLRTSKNTPYEFLLSFLCTHQEHIQMPWYCLSGFIFMMELTDGDATLN